jgi:hypothetical protein
MRFFVADSCRYRFLRDTIKQHQHRNRVIPQVSLEHDEMETLFGLVTAGLCVSLLRLPNTATFPPSPAENPRAPGFPPASDRRELRAGHRPRLAGCVLPPADETFRRHVPL